MKYNLNWVGASYIRNDPIWSTLPITISNESINPLDNSQFNYSLFIETDEDTYDKLSKWVASKASYPVELGIQRELLTANEIHGLTNIIKGLLPRIVGKDSYVDMVNIERYSSPSYILFTPYNKSGPYYMPINQSARVLELLDLGLMIGYDLLSDDPLIWLSIDQHQKGSNIASSGEASVVSDIIKSLGIVYWKGSALIPITVNPKNELVSSLQSLVSTFKSDEWFYYLLNPFNSEIDLIKELCELFPHMKIEFQMKDYVFIRSIPGYGKRFLDNAIDLIQGGSLPQLIIDLDINIPQEDNNPIESSNSVSRVDNRDKLGMPVLPFAQPNLLSSNSPVARVINDVISSSMRSSLPNPDSSVSNGTIQPFGVRSLSLPSSDEVPVLLGHIASDDGYRQDDMIPDNARSWKPIQPTVPIALKYLENQEAPKERFDNRINHLQISLQLKYWCQVAYAQLAEVNQAYLNTLAHIDILPDLRLSIYLGSEDDKSLLVDMVKSSLNETIQPRFIQMEWEQAIVARLILATDSSHLISGNNRRSGVTIPSNPHVSLRRSIELINSDGNDGNNSKFNKASEYKALVLEHHGQYFLAYLSNVEISRESMIARVNERYDEILAYTQEVCQDSDLDFENFRSCLSIPNPILEMKIDLNTLALRGVIDLGQGGMRIPGLISQIDTEVEGEIEAYEMEHDYYFSFNYTPILVIPHRLLKNANTIEDIRSGLGIWWRRADLLNGWGHIQLQRYGKVNQWGLRYYPELYNIDPSIDSIEALLLMLV